MSVVWQEREIILIRLKALEIAAEVFSQISDEPTTIRVEPKTPSDYNINVANPRTLSDFRESVDAVFKAAGLEKVEWE